MSVYNLLAKIIQNIIRQSLAGRAVPCLPRLNVCVRSAARGWTHQFGVELLRWAAAVHGHEGLCCSGHAVVVEIELTLALWAQATLGAAGEQGPLLRGHLVGKQSHLQPRQLYNRYHLYMQSIQLISSPSLILMLDLVHWQTQWGKILLKNHVFYTLT